MLEIKMVFSCIKARYYWKQGFVIMRDCNHGKDICWLFHILGQFLFNTSERNYIINKKFTKCHQLPHEWTDDIRLKAWNWWESTHPPAKRQILTIVLHIVKNQRWNISKKILRYFIWWIYQQYFVQGCLSENILLSNLAQTPWNLYFQYFLLFRRTQSFFKLLFWTLE